MATTFVSLDKMLKEEPSHTDMLTSSTKSRTGTTSQSITSYHRETSVDSLLPTLIFLSLQFLVTNWVMLKHIQTLSACGRHSSVTLPTELRLLSINLSLQVKPNGTSRTGLSCFCHMATTVLVQSTHHQESKDSCNSVTKTRSYLRTQRHTIAKEFSK